MGLFDTVKIDESIDIPGYDAENDDGDDPRRGWQTKSLDAPCMAVFRITADGELQRKEYEEVDRPESELEAELAEKKEKYDVEYNDEYEIVEDDSELDTFQFWEADIRKTRTEEAGWSTRDEYHGIFEIHGSVNDELVSYDVKFTNGEFIEITPNGSRF